MKALIVGAGIAGLSHARALARLGWQVQVLEAAPGQRGGGYMLDLWGLGYDAVEELGVLPELRSRGATFSVLGVRNPRGWNIASVDVNALAAAQGGRYFSILRPEVEAGLLAALPDQVSINYDQRVIGIDPAGVVRTAERECSADLVVAADGLRSTVRALLLTGDHVRPLGFHSGAWIGTDPDLAEELGAWALLSEVVGVQLAVYRVDKRRVAGFAIERSPTTELPADAADYLRTRFSGCGEIFDRSLALVPSDPYFDLVAQTVVPRWVHGRVVLVGDAAHAVSLLAGQGAGMAIAGANALASALRGRDKSGLQRGLAEYEARWRPVTDTQQRRGRRAANTFVPRSRGALLLRRVAFNMTKLPCAARLAGGLVGGGKAG